MNSGKERRGWSGGAVQGGRKCFEVCMWGCDMNRIRSVWKHIGGLQGLNSLHPKQASPLFFWSSGSFACLGPRWSAPSGLDAAEPDRAASVISYSGPHTPRTHASTHRQLCNVQFISCQQTVMFNLIAAMNGKHHWRSSCHISTGFQPFPGEAKQAVGCMFFQKQPNKWAGLSLPKKKNLPGKIFTINCNPDPKYTMHLAPRKCACHGNNISIFSEYALDGSGCTLKNFQVWSFLNENNIWVKAQWWW